MPGRLNAAISIFFLRLLLKTLAARELKITMLVPFFNFGWAFGAIIKIAMLVELSRLDSHWCVASQHHATLACKPTGLKGGDLAF